MMWLGIFVIFVLGYAIGQYTESKYNEATNKKVKEFIKNQEKLLK